VQLALPKLLELRTPILERTRANLKLLRERVAGSAINILNVEGGWYAVLQVPRTRSEEQWVLGLLRDRDVLAQPGFFYDFESEAFLVVSLLTAPQVFEEGVQRVLEFGSN